MKKQKRKIKKLPIISDCFSLIQEGYTEEDVKKLREEIDMRDKKIEELKAEIYDLWQERD